MEEDNEYQFFREQNRALREERLENFEQKYLPKLKENYQIEKAPDEHYIIHTGTIFGIIDFYPKKNSLCIRKQNKWIKPALKWLISNLLL